MRNTKIKEMAQLAILVAVTLVMAFTPIGYLRTAGLEISLITIPVAIGAMILGPGAGAALGLVFGLTSYYQCFGLSPFGAQLLAINPLLTFFVCVPTRALAGLLTGLMFRVMIKKDRTKTLSYFAGGLFAALFNTLFFMGVLVLCFWNSDYLQMLNQTFGGLNPLAFVFAFVGINGLCELPATCLAAGAVSKALAKSLRNL